MRSTTVGKCKMNLKLLLVHFLVFREAIEAQRNNITNLQGTTVTFKQGKTVELMVPKCCGLEEIIINGICTRINEPVEFSYPFYDSNETYINDEKYIRNLSVYVQNIQCPETRVKVGFLKEDIYGFIYNSSIIYINANTRTVNMLSPQEYCIEYVDLNRTIVFIHCAQRPPKSAMVLLPKLYLSFLILSALCFFGTAGFYYWIMSKENEHNIKREVHKKCFFGYSFSMGVTFCFLFALQKVDASCDVFGSLFFFSIICSFVWMTALCIDLVVLVKYFKDEQKDMFYWFAAASIILPMLLYGLSVIPDMIPDIPNSFVKHYTTDEMCSFPGQRMSIFFTPLIVCILISFVCLSYTYCLVRRYKENFKNDVDWIMNMAVFKYTFIKCLVAYIFMCIYFGVEVFSTIMNVSSFESTAPFDIVVSLQGFFICSIIFLHYWERRQISISSCPTTPEELPLNWIN